MDNAYFYYSIHGWIGNETIELSPYYTLEAAVDKLKRISAKDDTAKLSITKTTVESVDLDELR